MWNVLSIINLLGNNVPVFHTIPFPPFSNMHAHVNMPVCSVCTVPVETAEENIVTFLYEHAELTTFVFHSFSIIT